MDDSCAVCADDLEWVGYGSCGHKDVCSTCVTRLRFICDDLRCCICKTHSDFVFVTKALGEYTRIVTDFSTLPSQPREGKVGPYWYHEDTHSFFDDADHYHMVKAMCRLSCSICDKFDDQPQDDDQTQALVQRGRGRGYWRPRGRGHDHDHDHHPPAQEGVYRRRQRFRNIQHLKTHLNHQHHLFMCDLCLEGRKVFICEQKLYTRAQLNQHKRTGDSEVDGTESERGGFTGHPLCEFCRSSFYSENELYTHMSTEHYTCHICQRRHPGQYDYFRDYDDLEAHFRHDHFLCEDEACLAKKFIVFQTEADLKRHNALEHGGRMSRSKRNAVLQIPTSFRYRSSNESGYHRGRRRSFRRETSPLDNEVRMAIQASLNTANAGALMSEPSPSSAAAPVVGDYADTSDVEPLVQPFESLSTSVSEPSSRYRQAVSQISARPLEESSFPPLAAPPSTIQRSQPELNGADQNTMAARLRRQSNTTVLNVARPMPPKNRGPVPTASDSWPVPVPSAASVQMKPVTAAGSGSSSYATSLQARQATDYRLSTGGSWVKNPGIGSRSKHSSSAPNLLEIRSFDPVSDFPPVSMAQSNRGQSSGQATKTNDDVHTANKSLVERIRAALDFDEEKYSAFKEISQEYRQGVIGTSEYLEYVRQYELVHLVLDLAKLCPDTKKQRELIEAYNATQNNASQETFWGNVQIQVGGSSRSRKDKGKKVVQSDKSRPKDVLADSILDTVRSLQSQIKQQGVEEAEVLGKDGYRSNKGQTSLTADDKVGSNQYEGGNRNLGDGGGAGSFGKQKKKTSKFHRIRLGDAPPSAILDVRSNADDPDHGELGPTPNPTEGQSTRGVWLNGGGHRLFAK